MQNIKLLALAALVTCSLSGCFATTDLDRAAVGAAAGGVGAAVLQGNVATGILLGGAAGAVCDEVTSLCR